MEKIYYYPSAPREGYKNPYSINYKEALKLNFILLDDVSKAKYTAVFSFLKYAFLADVFVLNWVEDVAFAKFHRFKFIIVYLSLLVIRIRKCRIVWMIHNIHPHKGVTEITQFIQSYLFKHSSIIITHSKAAANFARKKSNSDIYYVCHPFVKIYTQPYEIPDVFYDVLIWGDILPYKGVSEFLSLPFVSQLKVKIIGRCYDEILERKIRSHCNDNVEYENRRISFDELKSFISKSRYIVFPYIGDCVSSSGALIDTLTLGGCVVGPYKGAFIDLGEEGLCLTYKNEKELKDILQSNIRINQSDISNFIHENTWSNISNFIVEKLNKNN